MIVTVKIFAILKDHFDNNRQFGLSDDSTVATLLTILKKEKPKAAAIVDNCRIAVGEELVNSDFVLQNGMEVYLLPPSSGG